MNTKRWAALAVFIVLVLIYSLADKEKIPAKEQAPAIVDQYLYGKEGDNWTTSVYREGKGKTLALLKIEGIILDGASGSLSIDSTYNHRRFLNQLQAAFEQPDIKGIILEINTPGGGVYESDEIYNRILELKARYKKPVVVYMAQQAASGGYYISMAADKIYANRNTLTGSIGVVISAYNYSELAKKVGIEELVFKSGPAKDMMNPMRPATDEEKQIMQGLVDESYGFFVDAVVRGRNLQRDQVLQLADGRIYTGPQAQKLGLLDEIGNLDSAVAGTAELVKTSDPKVLRFEPPEPGFWDWLQAVQGPGFDLLGIQKQIDRQGSMTLMYINK